jgi:hypothetical protein
LSTFGSNVFFIFKIMDFENVALTNVVYIYVIEAWMHNIYSNNQIVMKLICVLKIYDITYIGSIFYFKNKKHQMKCSKIRCGDIFLIKIISDFELNLAFSGF